MKKRSLAPTSRLTLMDLAWSETGNASHHRGSATSEAGGGGAKG